MLSSHGRASLRRGCKASVCAESAIGGGWELRDSWLVGDCRSPHRSFYSASHCSSAAARATARSGWEPVRCWRRVLLVDGRRPRGGRRSCRSPRSLCGRGVHRLVGLPDRSWDYANRTILYALLAGLGLWAAGRTRALANGLAILLGAVIVWSLLGKVLPFFYDYGGPDVTRLRGPIGLWNQLALATDYALALALCAARPRGHAACIFGARRARSSRTRAAASSPRRSCAPRGSALTDERIESAVTLVAAALPAAVVGGIAFALPGVTSDNQSLHVRWRDGIVFGALLLVGAAVALALERLRRPGNTRVLRRAAIALGVLAVSGAVVAVGSERDRLGCCRERQRPDRLYELELPVHLVGPGVARLHRPRAGGNRRRLVPPAEPALPKDVPRLHDRAAQPAGADARGARARRARAARARVRLAAARVDAPTGTSSRSRCCCRRSSSTRSSTSTGTSPRSRRLRSSPPARSSGGPRDRRAARLLAAAGARGRARRARVAASHRGSRGAGWTTLTDACPARARPRSRTARTRSTRSCSSRTGRRPTPRPRSATAYRQYVLAVRAPAEEPAAMAPRRRVRDGVPAARTRAWQHLERYTELDQKSNGPGGDEYNAMLKLVDKHAYTC